MDVKLKEAIAAVRAGDRAAAQQQLTALLEEKPEEAQGWYLLSLLVDSPQKQAAYLSKTLALDPNHPKAQAQLATLQGEGAMAPTSTIGAGVDSDESMDLLDQAESDSLPDWLQAEEFQRTAKPVEEPEEETAVPNDTLPDWLKEPALLAEEPATIEESPTVVGPTAQSDDKVDRAVTTLRQQTAAKVAEKPKPTAAKPQTKKSASKSTAGLNIVLGILIVLALLVMVSLAFLIFS